MLTGRPNVKDITFPRVDINFIFECLARYLTSESSERAGYRVKHEKIKFISTRGHVIFFLLNKHQWKWRDLLCNHNDGDLFACEDIVLFSRVKIWCFHAKAHLLFHWYLCNIYRAIFNSLRTGSSPNKGKGEERGRQAHPHSFDSWMDASTYWLANNLGWLFNCDLFLWFGARSCSSFTDFWQPASFLVSGVSWECQWGLQAMWLGSSSLFSSLRFSSLGDC